MHADALVVRLPFSLWLLVPALVGGGIGMTLAHRAAGPPVREAAAPAVVVHATSAASAVPRLVYRNAWKHNSLVTRTPGLHALAPAAGESTTNLPTAAIPHESDVVAFDSRTFAATPGDGRTASLPFVLTTPSLTDRPTASVANATFLLDGHPTFPTLVWGACSDQYASLLAVGIDTFLGKGCGDGAHEVAALGLHGYFVSDAKEPAVPGSVGSFLPDEWDTFLPSTVTSAEVQDKIPNNGGGPRFLTLTNHFFSKAAPLPQGRGMYPALVANADVLGFDLYPLENWCRFDDFPVVFDSQRELVNLAVGKPTFQWIEVRHMDCADPSLDPTPQTVRAETWLAVAGGAHAIGYFPKDFSPEIGAEIAREKRELETLTPALVAPPIDATANNNKVRVGARGHNGALYVIAVNASRAPSTATITVPALGNRSLVSLDGTRSVTAANGAFTDTFGPLDVHIYISAP